ncbi:hypothetical protein JTE90_009507 [Oedothorax gibbosus]|uniref:Anaphase-promoting complex subunit 13 n=1 Tax=Oedothorax gibbosus TaxID=931172 RepID=A0AAV6UUF4_9ARAC|nr:hypothetical protein JTE90_009507 [Oedothorax gibbosus]
MAVPIEGNRRGKAEKNDVAYCNVIHMDSKVARNGRLIDIVDSAWREEKLPDEPIAVPATELPDPEPDNGNPQETLREPKQNGQGLV